MKDGESLSKTIYSHLLEKIRSGCYADGKRLPTEKELSEQFFVSRITPKNALNQLAQEGIIIRIPGKGSFVRDNNPLPIVREINGATGKIIALIMGGYSSSFGLEIITGAMNTSQELGLHMVLKATYGVQEDEEKIIHSLLSAGVSGMIIQPVQGELYSPLIVQLALDNFPIVMLDRRMQGICVPFVGVDNVLLSYRATEKLIENGHKNIALIALADEKSSTIAERMSGFTKACMDHLLVVDQRLWLTDLNAAIQRAGITNENRRAYDVVVSEIREYLLEHPEVTAVFGLEYFVSKAAHDAIRRIGKRVPKDISLVSFDTDPSYIGPHFMSYVKQPQEEMGSTACRLLNDLLQHNPPAQNICLLPGEWVEGNTIRKLCGKEDMTQGLSAGVGS